MAVETYISTQLTEGVRKRPLDEHGKLRIAAFDITAAATAVGGDANSLFRLCKLPPGAVRILLPLSRLSMSAQGASRTLDIGHTSYQSRDLPNAAEAENLEAFVANMDVSSAVAAVAFGTTLWYDIYSKAGVEVRARIQGGTVPAGATLRGYVMYVYE